MKKIIISFLLCLISSSCAKDYGRAYSSSAVVEFSSSKNIFFYFLTSKEANILGSHDVFPEDDNKLVHNIINKKYRYQTNGPPWEIKKGRHTIITDCKDYFYKQEITIRKDGELQITCR